MPAPLDVDMLERACDITDRIMSGIQSGQLGDLTPCRDWAVRELMEHIVSSTDFFADAAEYGAVAEDRAWPEYSPEELLSAYRHHAGRLVAAFRVPGVMGRPMAILAGPPTAASASRSRSASASSTPGTSLPRRASRSVTTARTLPRRCSARRSSCPSTPR